MSAGKYRMLVQAMVETRNDWLEGFYRVANALTQFEIEDERDQEIYDDLLGCMDSDDGRVFRDTAWNYNRLLTLIEEMEQVNERGSDGSL